MVVNGFVHVVHLSACSEPPPNTLNLCKTAQKVRKVTGVTEEAVAGREGELGLSLILFLRLLQPIKVKVEF